MPAYQLEKILELPQWKSVSESFDRASSEIALKSESCKKGGILICSRSPQDLIGAFLAGVCFRVPLFLGNPEWKENEWKQFFMQVSPALTFGGTPYPRLANSPLRDLSAFQGYIMIPTGGSGGKVRFAMHTWDNLVASATATAAFLGKKKINSICLLPLYHISGLMQIIRAFLSGGEVLFDPLDSFDNTHNFQGFCLSLVPTQLKRLMEISIRINQLRTFDVVFLGGASASGDLLARAREKEIPLAPTYGTTETASMIAAMSPQNFLKGIQGVGQALPHAKLFINNEGRICVYSNSLFNGYFPDSPLKKSFWETSDDGRIDDKGYLTVIGRADRIIITGGEKVDPKDVEEVILSTGLVSSVIVTSKKDAEWGQRVVAICVPDAPIENLIERLKAGVKESLANYKVPKDWIIVDRLPYDEKGKITKESLSELT